MSRSAVILLFVVIASAILALSLPPEATLLAWCAWVCWAFPAHGCCLHWW
ncbi:Uncharacterised protein [Pseudomonas aeruginosa]|nr:Uncharacterised protein [Pseudomonas aeruginosa]